MERLLTEQHFLFLRFNAGENLIEELKKFLTINRIPSSTFTAIGATNEIILSFYDLEKKGIWTKQSKKILRLSVLMGTVHG